MSVPPDRMAARTPGTIKDPNKIMGLPKWAFFVIIAVGVVLAWYIYKRSQSSSNAALQSANAGAEPDTTNGVTAADIGGTPADNSFTTQTDAQALEEQIQSLQNSLYQLQQANGGNGAGLQGLPTTGPGGSPGPVPVTNPPRTPPGGIPGPVPVQNPPTEGVTVLTGNGIGNSPTAMQNLYATGVLTPTIPGGQGSVKVPGGRETQ